MVEQVLTWLRGKKTYVMIAVDAIDQVGIAQGWWEESKLRAIAEFVLTVGFLRAGVQNSGPVK